MNQNNQKTVYVLGAGASKGSPNNFKNIKNPCDNDFFETACNISWTGEEAIPVGELYALLGYLRIFYFCNLFGFTKPLLAKQIGLEDVFNSLETYSSWIKHKNEGLDYIDEKDERGNYVSVMRNILLVRDEIHAILQSYKGKEIWGQIENGTEMAKMQIFFELAKYELKYLIKEVLNKINSENNWGCKYHKKLVDSLNDKDAIMSFNYDILIDNAMTNSGKWNKEDGYHFWVHRGKKESVTGISLDWYAESIQNKSSNILLKLHGSLNWFQITDLITRKPHMFWAEDYEKLYNLYHLEVNDFWFMYNSKPTQPMKGKVEAAIIPPIVDKRKELGFGKFESLWAKALDQLICSKKIVFIGYSLPPADFLAKWLFRNGYYLNREKEQLKIEIVNPDPLATIRFKELYPKTSSFCNTFKTIEEYVESI